MNKRESDAMKLDRVKLQEACEKVQEILLSLMNGKDPPTDRATRMKDYTQTLLNLQTLMAHR